MHVPHPMALQCPPGIAPNLWNSLSDANKHVLLAAVDPPVIDPNLEDMRTPQASRRARDECLDGPLGDPYENRVGTSHVELDSNM
jgi:hypothetical protein